MRYKISLEVLAEKNGNILPISYQYELVSAINGLLMADKVLFENWLSHNGFSCDPAVWSKVYSISNLYIPKIFVDGDRLHINVPRIQFWISLLPSKGTEQMLAATLLQKEITIGDARSAVTFCISDIQTVTPVVFRPVMEYQTLSPMVIVGLRPNKTIEYLNPRSIYYTKFMVDELIDRYELIYNQRYMGDRRYTMELIMPERRKAVTVYTDTPQQQKVVGYMMKFRLYMDPELQEFAYTLGLGDKIDLGFGYIELLKK